MVWMHGDVIDHQPSVRVHGYSLWLVSYKCPQVANRLAASFRQKDYIVRFSKNVCDRPWRENARRRLLEHGWLGIRVQLLHARIQVCQNMGIVGRGEPDVHTATASFRRSRTALASRSSTRSVSSQSMHASVTLWP